MTETWEDLERLTEKFLNLSQLELYFAIAAIIFSLLKWTITTYTLLILLAVIAAMPLWKRRQYERRKEKREQTNPDL